MDLTLMAYVLIIAGGLCVSMSISYAFDWRDKRSNRKNSVWLVRAFVVSGIGLALLVASQKG